MTCGYKWLGEEGDDKSESSSPWLLVSELLCFTAVSSHGPSMCNDSL